MTSTAPSVAPDLLPINSRSIWKIAGPAVALSALQTVNGVLDTFFIGSLPGGALAAHGASLNIIFLMFSMLMTLSVASTALVSRAYGAGNNHEVREANRECLTVGAYLGVVLGLVGAGLAFVAPGALLPPGSTAIPMMTGFLLFFSHGLVPTTIIQCLAGSLRGLGDTKSPMVISGLQIILHMALNVVFIFGTRTVTIGDFSFHMPGLGMGLPGAALALSVSALFSMVVYLYWSQHTPLGAPRFSWAPHAMWVRRILNISIPAAGQAVLRVGSFTVLTKMLGEVSHAEAALGALRVGISMESLMFMPAFGLAISASTLVGQNLGAGRPDRAEQAGWLAGHHAALVVLTLSIPLWIWAPQIAAMQTGGNKPEMAMVAAEYLRIVILTEVLFAYAMVLIGAMQGAGDTKRTMWITIWSLWGVRIPLAWVLTFPMGLGAVGCWWALMGSQAVQGIIAMVQFRQGHWKKTQV